MTLHDDLWRYLGWHVDWLLKSGQCCRPADPHTVTVERRPVVYVTGCCPEPEAWQAACTCGQTILNGRDGEAVYGWDGLARVGLRHLVRDHGLADALARVTVAEEAADAA